MIGRGWAKRTAAEYRNIIAAYRNGVPVRLREIANVFEDVENPLNANFANSERSVGLAIYKQAEGNTVKIVDAIYERLPSYRAQIPPSVNMELITDRSLSIRDSVRDVQVTLAIAIVLVVLVIFLFLRSAAATIIPSLALNASPRRRCARGTSTPVHDFGNRVQPRRKPRHQGSHPAPRRAVMSAAGRSGHGRPAASVAIDPLQNSAR